ncbi:winged helix-turn-helix domain-containing protein [Shewanella carassii]|uniref:CadC family transcriptional regulator n=1 Tax=Shewanella carassii TaxID=1987584 RepID=A0ABQ1T000_9GAMM|nr:winged helix-turn-helix domain-containing protein [Shewanella carassii]GGE70752.1 CadC family transcriptional regulator [Shewanella carassii]
MQQLTPYLVLDAKAKHLLDQRDGSEIVLSFSEAQVLSHLLSAPGNVFGKDELLAVGWPERVVALTSLTQCISILRKKLEPYPEIQLKTVARRGYQLNISEQSHVHMLAISDGEAIRNALVSVSLKIKILGILLLLGLVGFFWYFSDYHEMVKHVSQWHADKQLPLNVGGTLASAQLFYHDGAEKLHPSMWQKHLTPEGNVIQGLKHFSAYAATDGRNYSFAVCPSADEAGCDGDGIINITTIDPNPAGLNMKEFLPLSRVMERRIRYNRIIIPAAVDDAEVIEHNYHADIYFPVAGELLVRTDLSLSLVYEGKDSGRFYSSACVTDQDCITTPIKYQLRGNFQQYSAEISGNQVDVFQVKVTQKELTKPNNVSDSAMHFYREIRKDDIRDEVIYYYRIHQDHKTAVWIVPQMGNLLAWTTYSEVKL